MVARGLVLRANAEAGRVVPREEGRASRIKHLLDLPDRLWPRLTAGGGGAIGFAVPLTGRGPAASGDQQRKTQEPLQGESGYLARNDFYIE